MDRSSEDSSWRYILDTIAIIAALIGLDKVYQYHHIICQSSYYETGQITRDCRRGTGQELSSNITTAAKCEVTLCMDDSCSYSSGSGTCSYHGGEWVLHHD